MKRKFSLSAVLLFITGLLLIAGIFFIGIQTIGQLLDTRKQFETFVSQIDKEQYTLTEAQASFDTAIQSKKDLLNYKRACVILSCLSCSSSEISFGSSYNLFILL